MTRTLLPLLLTAITFLVFGGTASAAKLDAPWTGTGPGTITVVPGDAAADPQFDYDYPAASGAWIVQHRRRDDALGPRHV